MRNLIFLFLILLIISIFKRIKIKYYEKFVDWFESEEDKRKKKEEAEKEEKERKEKENLVNNFFNRKMGTCLGAQEATKDICKIDANRPCKIQNSICYVNEDDDQNAREYAYRKLCIEKGYCFIKNDDGSYECTFTKDSCLKNSKQRKDARISSLIDEKGEGSLRYGYMEWREGVGCVDGTGFELVKKMCETENACSYGKLKYDSTTGNCKITPAFCEEMRMTYENGKCFPKDVVAETMFGKSMVRGVTPCPRYTDTWNRLELTNSKDKSEHYQKVLSDICIKESIETEPKPKPESEPEDEPEDELSNFRDSILGK